MLPERMILRGDVLISANYRKKVNQELKSIQQYTVPLSDENKNHCQHKE
jgi:hypothetical protein